jgi:glycosyltransferase involved in cell wall biosynthesis
MNLLLFADYLFRSPWRQTAWVPQIGRALAARGHQVTIACDGARDLAVCLPCRAIVRRPLRTWRSSAPIGFSRWARALARDFDHDASLSFTPLAPADALLPVGGAVANLRLILGAMSPISAGLELAHQPWLPAVAAVELARARSAPGVRLRFGLPVEGDSAAAVGYASRLPPAGAESERRDRVRRALGIGDRRPVLFLSSVHPKRSGLEPMLRALAETRADARPALAPIALVAGRNGYSIHAAAARAGCPDGVRILGGTNRIADVLAACDLVVVPGAARHDFVTGRLIADALRCARPVLADRQSPGAELLEPGPGNGYASPGMIVERRTAPAWREALATAMTPQWSGPASAAARLTGEGLSMEALAARIEAVLGRAAARRREAAVSRP